MQNAFGRALNALSASVPDQVRQLAEDVATAMSARLEPISSFRRSPELSGAWHALQAKDFDGVVSVAMPHIGSPNAQLRAEANKLVGLAHFEKGAHTEAVPYFEAAVQESTDAGDWFNLASSATMASEIELGRHAFSIALRCQEEAGYAQHPSVPFMRLWYASALREIGEYSSAFEQLEALRSIYEQLRVTDTMFLYIRNIPSLPATMKIAVDVLRGLGPSFDAIAWIDHFASSLDTEGQECLQRFRAELTTRT